MCRRERERSVKQLLMMFKVTTGLSDKFDEAIAEYEFFREHTDEASTHSEIM